MFGLNEANANAVKRVAKFVELTGFDTGEVMLIMELIRGNNLYRHCKSLFAPGASPEVKPHEQHVLRIAAQLLQTIYSLHEYGAVCHLDISSSNIMLRTEPCDVWDQVRLRDFGFCQQCVPCGCSDYAYIAEDNFPCGATPAYASPEILASIQLQHEQADRCTKGVGVNGMAADYRSIGVVLYELLTGQLPFDITADSAPGTAPSSGHTTHSSWWHEYQAIRQLQQSWIDACNLVLEDDEAQVQHPLLDRVRQCSSNPDQAALFFKHILSPIPHRRIDAMFHAWCKDTINTMFAETGTTFEHPPVPNTECSQARPLEKPQSSKRGFTAALLSWCSCSSSPQVKDSQISPPIISTHGLQHIAPDPVASETDDDAASATKADSKAGKCRTYGRKAARWLKAAVPGKAKKKKSSACLEKPPSSPADHCLLSSTHEGPFSEALSAADTQQAHQQLPAEQMSRDETVQSNYAAYAKSVPDPAVITIAAVPAATSSQLQPLAGSQLLHDNDSTLQQAAMPCGLSAGLPEASAPAMPQDAHRDEVKQSRYTLLLHRGKETCMKLLGKRKDPSSSRKKPVPCYSLSRKQ